MRAHTVNVIACITIAALITGGCGTVTVDRSTVSSTEARYLDRVEKYGYNEDKVLLAGWAMCDYWQLAASTDGTSPMAYDEMSILRSDFGIGSEAESVFRAADEILCPGRREQALDIGYAKNPDPGPFIPQEYEPEPDSGDLYQPGD